MHNYNTTIVIYTNSTSFKSLKINNGSHTPNDFTATVTLVIETLPIFRIITIKLISQLVIPIAITT